MKPKNKVKMRICKDEEAVCKVCGTPRSKSLEIYEIAFTDKQIIRICDECNEQLFSKVLKASSMLNHRVKSNAELRIIRQRNLRNKNKI